MARSLNEKSKKEVQQETRRAGAAKRTEQQANKFKARSLNKWPNENELKSGR
jgi:hypothetical protein